MSCWQILGVNSDADKKTIKLAYAKKLKATRPDDDPEGFIALHQAYKTALQDAARGADNTAETVQTTGPTHQQSSSASSFRDDGRLAKYAEKATIEAPPPTDNVTGNSDEILVVSRVEAPDYNDQAETPVTSAVLDEVPSYGLPEYQIRLGADKENALAHAHELIGDPQRVNSVEEWQYVESIPSMIDLDFSADLGDLLFELVSRANVSTLKDNKPFIKEPVLNYLSVYFHWDKNWKHYEKRHGYKQSNAVFMFTGEKSNIRSKRQEVHAARRAMAFGIDIALLFMLMFALTVMGMQNSISNMTFSFIALYWLVGIPVLEASKWQASIGKRLFGLIVVDGNNRRIGLGRSFGRCYLSYLSLLIMQFSVFANAYVWFRYNELIHDTLSKSYVTKRQE